MHTLGLVVAALALTFGAFASWRAQGGAFRRTPWVWLVGWTLWLTELGLTVWLGLTTRAPESLQGGGYPHLDNPVDLHLPADLQATPSDTPTVLFVGDSFTIGAGVRYVENLPSMVHQRLATPDHPVRVLNQGREGRSLFDEVVSYEALGAPASPDVVVWVFVLNDIGRAAPKEPHNDFVVDRSEPPRTGLLLLDVPMASASNRRLQAETELSYQQALSADNPTLEHAGALLQGVASEVTGRGGRFLFVIYPMMHALDAYPFAEAHRVLGDLGRAAGAEVVDLLPAFEGRDAPSLWVSSHDHHPNAKGHRIAANVVAQVIAEGGLPDAGPTRCELLPPMPPVDARPACDDPGPDGLVTLARDLVTQMPPPPARPFSGPRVGLDLIGVAAARGAPVEVAQPIVEALEQAERGPLPPRGP